MERNIKPMVKKTFVVCAAHRLMDHPGACKRLHGHNYLITVHLGHRAFDTMQGMVVDFGLVKQHLGAMINTLFDHVTILQDTDPLVPGLKGVFGEAGVTTVPFPPTAENMARFLVDVLQQQVEVLEWRGIYVDRVEVEETPNNTAYAWRS